MDYLQIFGSYGYPSLVTGVLVFVLRAEIEKLRMSVDAMRDAIHKVDVTLAVLSERVNDDKRGD